MKPKIILASILLSVNSFANEGNERGNGGNDVALQFAQTLTRTFPTIARQIYSSQGQINGFGNDDLERLKNIAKQVRIKAVNYKLCENDNDQKCPSEDGFVAKNYPKKMLIVVNSDKWRLLDPKQKSRIALHEYLGIMGLERGTYGISSQIVAFADSDLKQAAFYFCQIAINHKGYSSNLENEPNLISMSTKIGIGNVSGFSKTREFKNKDIFEDLPKLIDVDGFKFNAITVSGVIGSEYLRLKLDLELIENGIKTSDFTLVPETVVFSGEVQAIKVIKQGQFTIITSCTKY